MTRSLSLLFLLMLRVDAPPAPAAPLAQPEAAPAQASAAAATVRAGEVMIRARAGASLEDVAQRHGARVVRPAGRSGLALVETDDVDGLLARLSEDPEAERAESSGRIYALGNATEAGAPHQWHLDAAGAAGAVSPDVIIAVLDSGLAAGAPSLSDTVVVSPWDFVDGDDDPADGHGHGTHISTAAVGDGALSGVAPGASLMPLRVLGDDGSGLELDLIEAIYHAVDTGADIINMSLAMEAGYVPSLALLEALGEAAEAGVVMVAAAGNDGLPQVAWPAASPLVIAVGASGMVGDGLEATWYASHGPLIDILAPGGIPGQDVDGDGVEDGIIAESIDPSGSGAVAPWIMYGSSQAAALVSGAAAQLLDAGAAPESVSALLQLGASGLSAWDKGHGAGHLDVAGALSVLEAGELAALGGAHVAIVPGLELSRRGRATATSRLLVLDDDGHPVADASVYGTLRAVDQLAFYSCETDEDGQCEIRSEAYAARGLLGMKALTWSFTAETVVIDGYGVHPDAAIFADAGLEEASGALAEGLAHSVGLVGGVFGVDVSPPFRSAPMAVVATESLLSRLLEEVLGVTVLGVYGSDGTGLSSSPIGMSGRTQKRSLGDDEPCEGASDCDGAPVFVADGAPAWADLSDTAIQGLMDGGGWVDEDGRPSATALVEGGSLAPLHEPVADPLDTAQSSAAW